jgi:hypothetical protein
MATAHQLVFDHRRPFGPLEDNDTCTTGLKTLSFDSKAKAIGYTHGMQLSPLLKHRAEAPMVHVLSLKLTGMVQEYGFNAVSVVMQRYDGGLDDIFSPLCPARKYDLELISQFTCPWEHTRMTLAVDPDKSKVSLYVEQAIDDGKPGDKRRRDDPDPTAMPYFNDPKEEAALWTDHGEGIKSRHYTTTWMHFKSPNIGIRMSAGLGNRVEIVPVSAKAAAIIAAAVPLDKQVHYA